MKSDVAFALENAGWPALLVDGAGTICRANPAANSLFGAALDGESPRLSAVWAPENSSTADQFLAQWERSAAPTLLLKFRGKGGQTVGYLTSICAFTKDGQKYFVLQLLRESAAAAAEAEAAGGDAGLALKQKLDCALQLARTVALDFNNALTSILGHTSLVLSKMEPNHPWRSSLIEVEKSAAKAAEIANDLGTFSRQEKEARAQAAGNLNLLLQRSVEFFQQNAGPEPVAWTLQLDRKLFAAKFDEAKMQQAFMKIIENALQALRGTAAASPCKRATSNWRSRRRTATCSWPPALMCAWKSPTTAAASSRMSCRGCLSRSSRPSAAPAIAGWVWPGSMALSPTTAAAWPSPASPAPAPPSGCTCPAEKQACPGPRAHVR